MHFELPNCRRCCLCLPLRHGILIFGYLNLLFALYLLTVNIYFDVHSTSVSHSMFAYRGVEMRTQQWFCYFIFVMEIIFNVVLLVGAHWKRTLLIRVYYYYGIVTTLASFVTYLVIHRKLPLWKTGTPLFDPFDFYCAFAGLVLQCYLLLLIRSELKKLQHLGGDFHYVNQAAGVLVDPLPPGQGREGGHAVECL